MWSTLICAIRLSYASLSTFHTIFNIYYQNNKKSNYKFIVVAIRIDKQSHKFLQFGFDPG